MKRKIVCQLPGYWIAFENGKVVNSIMKTHHGWELSYGYYSHGRVFASLSEARAVAFCM